MHHGLSGQHNVIFMGMIFNKHAHFYHAARYILYIDSEESCFHSCKLNTNSINLLESNHLYTVQCLAVEEEIEHCKNHPCIIGGTQMMLMLPSA